MAIYFKELDNSPVETFDASGLRVERYILCRYTDRRAATKELFGDFYEFGGSGRANYPNLLNVLCVRVQWKPFNAAPDNQGLFSEIQEQLQEFTSLTDDFDAATTKFVEGTVTYETLPIVNTDWPVGTIEPDTFLTYRKGAGGEYITLPGRAMTWGDWTAEMIGGLATDPVPPVPPDAYSTVRVPVEEHVYSWHQIIKPPETAIRALLGTVNAEEWSLPHRRIQGVAPSTPYTLLFDSATMETEYLTLDDLQKPKFFWRLNYTFREKAIKALDYFDAMQTYGWVHTWRSEPVDSPGWDRLVDQRTGDMTYRLDNHYRQQIGEEWEDSELVPVYRTGFDNLFFYEQTEEPEA